MTLPCDEPRNQESGARCGKRTVFGVFLFSFFLFSFTINDAMPLGRTGLF